MTTSWTNRTSPSTSWSARTFIFSEGGFLKINGTDFLKINGTDKLIISLSSGTPWTGRVIP